MTLIIKAKPLRVGDAIGVVAPAGPVPGSGGVMLMFSWDVATGICVNEPRRVTCFVRTLTAKGP